MTGTSTCKARASASRDTREWLPADRELICAHLNLYALLQNLEELVRLDEQAAEITRNWDVSVQFTVRRGPAAYLEFADGQCRHQRGRRTSPNVSLYFASSRHLNAMFDGRAIPVPLRGFTRLGWLRTKFGRLTDRLEACLKPTDEGAGKACEKLRATLLLQTAAFASSELAVLEPTCRKIAARLSDGVLTVESLPGSPTVHVVVSGGLIQAVKSSVEAPTAKLTFSDASVAVSVMENRLDPFEALAAGDLTLSGKISMIDDFLLILDRVEEFLT